MLVVDFFKKVFKLTSKNEPVISSLISFNRQTNNNINSAFASLASIKGHNIEVLENTIIDPHSELGSYTYIGMNSAVTKAVIGRYCSIGNNVSIGPGEHDLSAISTSALFYDSPLDVLTQKDCIIGNDVWIGVDCIIKRGVKIGDGAVIGANSVVTKDVPAYAVVAGSPAKLLRYRFNENVISHLLESAWWNYDLQEAKLQLEQLKTSINH